MNSLTDVIRRRRETVTISLIPTDGRHCSPAGWYDDVFTCFIFSFICSNFCCFKFGLLLLWGPFLFAAGGRSRGKLRGFLNFFFKFYFIFKKRNRRLWWAAFFREKFAGTSLWKKAVPILGGLMQLWRNVGGDLSIFNFPGIFGYFLWFFKKKILWSPTGGTCFDI